MWLLALCTPSSAQTLTPPETPVVVDPAPAALPTEAPSAIAAPPREWTHKVYGMPRGNVRAIRVGQRVGAQALVGLEGGVVYRRDRAVGTDLLGQTRVIGDGLYGLTARSFGYNVRLGSFLGPTTRFVTFQFGPDLWMNQYGSPGALDYHLPFSPGIDAVSLAILHVHENVDLHLGVTPGWAFLPARQVGRIGPFHEITGLAAVAISAGGFSLIVGYQRVINAAGTTDGILLAGGF